jgi:polar amino acid transport system permease protein
LNFQFDFSPVRNELPSLLMGCLGTMGLALAGMALATIIGVGGVILRDSRFAPFRWLVKGFVELIRNTPFLVQCYFIFFALPLLGEQLGIVLFNLGIAGNAGNALKLNPTSTAVIALGLNGGAYAIEIIRGGVQAIGKGQVEAGLALGLRKSQVFRDIVLKPALRAIYPSLTSQFTLLTLTTSVASAIAAYELTSVAEDINGRTFRTFEIYFTVTLMYLAMSSLMAVLFNAIARRHFSYPVK